MEEDLGECTADEDGDETIYSGDFVDELFRVSIAVLSIARSTYSEEKDDLGA